MILLVFAAMVIFFIFLGRRNYKRIKEQEREYLHLVDESTEYTEDLKEHIENNPKALAYMDCVNDIVQ